MEITNEPRVGSIVVDNDGDIWVHGPNGWGLGREDGMYPWRTVLKFGPVRQILAEQGEPPVGSIVVDNDGDIWARGPNGWGLDREDGTESWDYVLKYGPRKLKTPLS